MSEARHVESSTCRKFGTATGFIPPNVSQANAIGAAMVHHLLYAWGAVWADEFAYNDTGKAAPASTCFGSVQCYFMRAGALGGVVTAATR
jgi:hypothetical protein